MSARDSIRRANARFTWRHETAPRLEREAAERKAKHEAESVERKAKYEAILAKYEVGSAERDARMKSLGVDMPAFRAKYGVS
jgi:hypothetical protein